MQKLITAARNPPTKQWIKEEQLKAGRLRVLIEYYFVKRGV